MVITLEFLRKTNFHFYKKFKTLSWKNYICLKLHILKPHPVLGWNYTL